MGKIRRKELKKMKKESELKNGSLLLKERISYFNGKYFNPIRSFSMKELKNATNDYNTSLIFDHDVGNCIWYKGSLEGRTISIRTNFYEGVEMAINEIAIASQMKTQIPILVYEFPSGIDRIFSPPNPLSWKSRLRIAYDIANVHHSYRYQTLKFLSDQDCAAKLSDGEMQVEDEIFWHSSVGTFDWEKAHSIMHEERASIQDYAQSFVNTYNINGIVDPIILAQPRGIHEELQFQAIFDLAMRCSMKDMDERPTIVNAAKEVRRIQKFVP
ncbi:hypothetical protein AAG906_016235 [Vitis piasezkii]